MQCETAPTADLAFDGNSAAMRAGGLLDDGQSETAAELLGTCRSRVSIERLEDMLQLARRNARSLVGDPDFELIRIRMANRPSNPASGRGITDRVVEQVHQR